MMKGDHRLVTWGAFDHAYSDRKVGTFPHSPEGHGVVF